MWYWFGPFLAIVFLMMCCEVASMMREAKEASRNARYAARYALYGREEAGDSYE